MPIYVIINDERVVFATIENLVARLGEEPPVTSVDLEFIGPDGAAAIAEALKINTAVTRLDFDDRHHPAISEIIRSLLTPEAITRKRVLSAQSKIADCIKEKNREKYDANELAEIYTRSTSPILESELLLGMPKDKWHPNIEKLEDFLRVKRSKNLKDLSLIKVLENTDSQVGERGASPMIMAIEEALKEDFESKFIDEVVAELTDKYKDQIATEIAEKEREEMVREDVNVAAVKVAKELGDNVAKEKPCTSARAKAGGRAQSLRRAVVAARPVEVTITTPEWLREEEAAARAGTGSRAAEMAGTVKTILCRPEGVGDSLHAPRRTASRGRVGDIVDGTTRGNRR